MHDVWSMKQNNGDTTVREKLEKLDGQKKKTLSMIQKHIFFKRINKGSKFYFYLISSMAGYSGFQVKCGDFYIAFI